MSPVRKKPVTHDIRAHRDGGIWIVVVISMDDTFYAL